MTDKTKNSLHLFSRSFLFTIAVSAEYWMIYGHYTVEVSSKVLYTPFTRRKNNLDHDLDTNLDCYQDRDPEDVPVYMGHSLLNTSKNNTLLFIVQPLLHHLPPNIWIKSIQIAIQIECLHGTKFLDQYCKRGISLKRLCVTLNILG